MNSMIRVVVTLKIEPGKRSEFIEVIKEGTIGLEASEPRTKGYEWYMDDNDQCIVVETYEDSAAIFEHMANTSAGKLPNPVPELASVENMLVLGPASDELKNALTERREPRLFRRIASFSR